MLVLGGQVYYKWYVKKKGVYNGIEYSLDWKQTKKSQMVNLCK